MLYANVTWRMWQPTKCQWFFALIEQSSMATCLSHWWVHGHVSIPCLVPPMFDHHVHGLHWSSSILTGLLFDSFSLTMNLLTETVCFCPIQWIRIIAWSSTAGFLVGSHTSSFPRHQQYHFFFGFIELLKTLLCLCFCASFFFFFLIKPEEPSSSPSQWDLC